MGLLEFESEAIFCWLLAVLTVRWNEQHIVFFRQASKTVLRMVKITEPEKSEHMNCLGELGFPNLKAIKGMTPA